MSGLAGLLGLLVTAIEVEAPGCPGLEAPIASALSTELPGDQTRSGERAVRVELGRCDDTEWTAVLLGGGREVLAGPTRLDLARFTEASRVRAVALWAAEALTTTSRGRVQSEGEAESRDRPSPEAVAFRRPTMVFVGAGAGAIEDPAALSDFAPFVRVGTSEALLPWLEVGGAIEGGALFEPFDHHQPWLRFCGELEAGAQLRVDGLRVAVGPRACVSGSRHLRGSEDQWAAGVALGGLMRVSLPLTRDFAVGFRLDVEAWERDLLIETSPTTRVDPSVEVADLPWLIMVSGGVELRFLASSQPDRGEGQASPR